MCDVIKATPIQYIDENKLKSYRTGLINHTWPISHHIPSLVINVLKGGHTDRQTDTHTHTNEQAKTISQETSCAGPSTMRTWFKNLKP